MIDVLTIRRAIFVYEAARLEAIAACRPVVPERFEDRDRAFRAQFLKTIERICADGYETTPEREHESWVSAYELMGWKYGAVRNVRQKTHPDILPFDELPQSEREKDFVFLALCDIARKYIRQPAAPAEKE